MIKMLTKHGNSYALIIDRPVMDLLKIDPETALDVTTDGQALIVTPAKSDDRRTKLKRAIERGNAKFGRTLRRLAN